MPDSHAERVAWFIHNACPDHHVRGAPARTSAWHTAGRLLRRHPELARDGIHTAVACGELAEVERLLAERPRLAVERGGPKGWEPLLYLCFARLPHAAAGEHAVAIARLLLDHGADPNAYFMAGGSRYTPFVGVIGEGEEDGPPHPFARELTELLLQRGAEPYDTQVLYDTHFHGHQPWLLELIHRSSVQAGREADWRDPAWRMLDMGDYGSGARYLLGGAVAKNDLLLAEWLLAHGADPNAAPARDPRMSKRSLYEDAVRAGRTEMADLLLRHGATPSEVVYEGEDAFADACFRLDRDAAAALLARHPGYRQSPRTMHAAAGRDRADVVALLLDLGVSPDVADPAAGGQRPLHVAAYAGALGVAALLVERGAEIDPVESNWSATPLGFAEHAGQPQMVALLSPVSRDVWILTHTGNVERLRAVLRTEPERARAAYGDGETLLTWLPDDEERAREIAELLLAHGADATVRDAKGRTAADRASRRGLDAAAALLRARE